ncbi:hypothetical protein [Alteribacter natronophilus]|uniref:hypothetical protein n=1 Tax=Alteribacter natronophilus TaxID=2583810 RepID=UPI00110DFA9C|nr:hypothetical protein [Alteribacter natronophilus]TMW72308.1 hypothetical protein FGB90_08855 [Alteribacter natronophilus]
MSKAGKGSRFLLGELVNGQQARLSELIIDASPSLLAFKESSAELNWKSPLAKDNYREYQDDFLNHCSLEDETKITMLELLREHWPIRGPVWDGIATIQGSGGKEGLIIVEAKANIAETYSAMKATSNSSIRQIKNSFRSVQQEYQSNAELIEWTDRYYQFANRLTYLFLLNRKLRIPTWLVNIYFVNDPTHIGVKRSTWHSHLTHMYHKLGLNLDTDLSTRMVNVFPEVNDIRKKWADK